MKPLHEALEISQERSQWLIKWLTDALGRGPKTSDVLSEIKAIKDNGKITDIEALFLAFHVGWTGADREMKELMLLNRWPCQGRA